MFFREQDKQNQKEYIENLTIIGSLSNLFSDSKIPFLFYRVAEKIFCRSFSTDDLSRSDISIDSKKKLIGIGLKTFLAKNNKTFQKVAEFDSERYLYGSLSKKRLVKKIAELRNARIEFARNLYNLDQILYHCVIRDENKFQLYEEPMDKIDIFRIGKVKLNRNTLLFDDEKNQYSFSLSKSTLSKRFNTSSILEEINIRILNEPFGVLRDFFAKTDLLFEEEKRILDTVFLPLYGSKQKVYPKSGLNQWNAGGRDRHENEVYIPIPLKIHQRFPSFFPDRDTPFDLRLPTGKILQTKVCQQGGKALMSYSNRDLGYWILRDVLNLPVGELLTYDKLSEIGIDSVRIDKIDELEYEINFSFIGAFEDFQKNYLL